MILNGKEVAQVQAYIDGLNRLEGDITADYSTGEQIRVGGSVKLVNSNGEEITLVDTGDGFELDIS